MAIHAGIDTGGTFTDLVVLDDESGALSVAKRPSTPADPAAAVFAAFEAASLAPADTASIVLGTTIATNALIQRRGATVIYVTTAGFEDVPVIGRVDKKDPYDLAWVAPGPLVRRARCLGLAERIGWDGTVVEPLAQAGLEQLAATIGRQLDAAPAGEDAAVAVNLLFAFANPEHEQRLGRFLAERFPGLAVSLSRLRSHRSGVSSSAARRPIAVNAFLKPAVGRLVARLRGGDSRSVVPRQPSRYMNRTGVSAARRRRRRATRAARSVGALAAGP